MKNEKIPGPNDFHFEMVAGRLTQMPGLGADEPSAKEAAEIVDAMAEVTRREQALERAAADVRHEALAFEARQAAAEKRENERADEHRKAMDELAAMRADLEAMQQAAANPLTSSETADAAKKGAAKQ